LRSNTATTESLQRTSPGLEQFFASLPAGPTAILDLAGASQANVGFITGLGHRLHSDDMGLAIENAFGEGPDSFQNQNDPARVERFMSATLDFPVNALGGALLWDTLQFLSPSMLEQTLDQLFHIVEPGSSLLAFFHADERSTMVPVNTYRIVDRKTIRITQGNKKRQAQYFNNRALERVFQRFQAVKFFLSRDNLREVIVRR
jgi:hypothetical protein